MIKVYISDATKEFVEEVNLKLEDFLKYYITIQEDFDVKYRFEGAFPNFLYRINRKRCEEVIRELLEYTTDKFLHTLTPLHEYALFQIIRYCEESYQVYEVEKEEGKSSLFDIAVNNEVEEDETSSTENGGYSLDNFHSFNFYYENLFEDFDFMDVDFYYKLFVESPDFFYESAHMEIDNYVELMPPDIKDEFHKLKEIYKKKGIIQQGYTFSENSLSVISDEKGFLNHIQNMIKGFKYNIEHRSVYQLLWNDDSSPRDEKTVQLLFLYQVSDYCKKHDIDITRESNTGRGPVDFKLSKGNSNRVLIELKLASNPNLTHGLEKQLVQYMISENVRNALYLVICFTEKENDKASRLLEIIDGLNSQYDCSISLEIIDAAKNKKSASKLSKDHKFKYIKWN